MADTTNALYFYAGYIIGMYKEQDNSLDRKKQLFNNVEINFTKHPDREKEELNALMDLLAIIKKYKPSMACLYYKITNENRLVSLCEIQLSQEKIDDNWIEYKGENYE
jgi:hypothetical protein